MRKGVFTGARLAQSVEHETLNLRVVGSSPTLGGLRFCFFLPTFGFITSSFIRCQLNQLLLNNYCGHCCFKLQSIIPEIASICSNFSKKRDLGYRFQHLRLRPGVPDPRLPGPRFLRGPNPGPAELPLCCVSICPT